MHGRVTSRHDEVRRSFFVKAEFEPIRGLCDIDGRANLVWEIAHLPLYTLWESPDLGEKIFAVLHCTLGDVMIALKTLLIALLLFGNPDWPARHWSRVALVTIALGLAYTVFSEWLNISIRQSWA